MARQLLADWDNVERPCVRACSGGKIWGRRVRRLPPTFLPEALKPSATAMPG